ncbi:MAG: VWA domain-containing protein [Planctomycetes bacterium]|nr:VWA domain-containing protein [Planctomycetota bacterium]
MTGPAPAEAPSSEPSPGLAIRVGERTFALEPDRLHVVGSGPRADLRVLHHSIAAAHALVSAHRGEVRVEDLGAPGGVWVGSVRVHGCCDLLPGAELRIGEIPLTVVAAAPAVASPAVAAPAALPAAPATGTAARPHAGAPEHGFAALMAEELRRAPWFGLSLLLHAVLFLLLYVFWQQPPLGTARELTISVAPEDWIDVPSERPDAPKEVFEVEESTEISPEELQEVEIAEARLDAEELEADFSDPGGALFDPFGAAHLTEIIKAGGEDILQSGSAAAGRLSGEFRRTVAGLRESGLEIVFVFDSTGSMGPVIEATRQRMTRMLEALYALVPDARIGVVTYRDHGRLEEYLTRSVPLSRDLYAALLFMHTVSAGGGGDRPEAVYDGLQEALQQPWRPGSRRVVVLIGDAPAHEQTDGRLRAMVEKFTRGGDAFVHAITTSPDFFGKVPADTQKSFESVARAGKGLCVQFEREDKILDQVLALAIGSEHRASVAEVFDILEERRRSRPPHAPVTAEIERNLRRPVVDPHFVDDCIRSADRRVAEDLIALLQNQGLGRSGRHAAAWAVQKLLGLDRVLVDPLDPRPLDSDLVARLQRWLDRLAPSKPR